MVLLFKVVIALLAVVGIVALGLWDALGTRRRLRDEAGISDGRLMQALKMQNRVRELEQLLAAARGEYATYLVELYNFNGLPMLAFYAAESELSAHIFPKDENVTTARVRVLRLHGAAPDARKGDGATPDVPIPTFHDRLGAG